MIGPSESMMVQDRYYSNIEEPLGVYNRNLKRVGLYGANPLYWNNINRCC